MEIGNIKISDRDVLLITDPGAGPSAKNPVVVYEHLPGEYLVHTEIVSGRVALLQMIHKDYVLFCQENVPEEILDQDVLIDSGMCGIFKYQQYSKATSTEEGLASFYEKLCNETPIQGAVMVGNLGVSSSTGHGDGAFPIAIQRNDHNAIVGIHIVFIQEEKEE